MRHRSRPLTLALLLTAGASLSAQGAPGCDVTIRVAELDCTQCTIHTGMNHWVEFSTEPTVRRVEPGDSSGLRRGDVIVSVDRALITTATGAQRFARPNPDRPSVVVVRREGKEVTLNVTPHVRCPVVLSLRGDSISTIDATRRFTRKLMIDSVRRPMVVVDTLHVRYTSKVVDSVGRPLRVRSVHARPVTLDSVRVKVVPKLDDSAAVRAGIIVRHPTVDTVFLLRRDSIGKFTIDRRKVEFTDSVATPGALVLGVAAGSGTGWLGFGLECDRCSTRRANDGRTLWTFTRPPVIAGISPDSPARKAGLRLGDTLQAIDGLDLTTARGAERFSSIRAGEKVSLTIVRGGKSRTVVLTAMAKGRET